MFTGLIEAKGTVASIVPGSGSARLTIASDLPAAEISLGESVAVDGVCLTVASRAGGRLSFDVVAETLARSTLGRRRPGDEVNLERAVRLSDRLGGHLVQGHVDGVCRVARVTSRGGDRRLVLRLTPEVRGYIALKGSVALNGVSLTVASKDRSTFGVALIPETLRRTNLASLRAGSEVNVEVDLVARYLEALSERPKGR